MYLIHPSMSVGMTGLKRTKLGLKWYLIDNLEPFPLGLKRTKLGLKSLAIAVGSSAST